MRGSDPPTFVGHSPLPSAKAEAQGAKEGASADSAEDKEGYHGCKPVAALFLKIRRRDKAAAQGILADGTGLEKLKEIIWTAGL